MVTNTSLYNLIGSPVFEEPFGNSLSPTEVIAKMPQHFPSLSAVHNDNQYDMILPRPIIGGKDISHCLRRPSYWGFRIRTPRHRNVLAEQYFLYVYKVRYMYG